MSDISVEGQQRQVPEVLRADALVERMKFQNPDLAGNISDKRLAAIVRAAVQALAAEINAREAGRFRVPGLGNLAVREVERERDGEMVRSKRIFLRLAQPKN